MMRPLGMAALLCAAGIHMAQAQAIWHCSRNPASAAPAPVVDPVLTVKIPFELSSNMVALELSDLYRVYSGIPVRVNGMPLSACFLDGGNEMNATAMGMLGLSPSALGSLARSTSIVSNHVFDVSNEQQMEACIREHHPAVGYLSKAKQSEGITPCF
jgi:hypothetical protein